MSEVWFAIPSASVERCRLRLPAWRERGYRIAILQNEERGDIPADITRWSDRYPGWAESINILCRDIVPASPGGIALPSSPRISIAPLRGRPTVPGRADHSSGVEIQPKPSVAA